MSPMLTERGPVPVGKSTLGEKVGVAPPVSVVLSRMEALPLLEDATAKSGLLSPLMSPMLTEMGPAPVVKVTWEEKVGVAAPVAVVLSRMEAVSLPTFTTAKSGLPSPLMSSMLMEKGLVPVVKVTWEEKVGVAAPVAVVLSRMEAGVLVVFGPTKSGFPWA